MRLFYIGFLVAMVAIGSLVVTAPFFRAGAQTAPQTDPFVAAVMQKQSEIDGAQGTIARNSGTYSDQLIRDHQIINDLSKQIADLKAENEKLKGPPAAPGAGPVVGK